MTSEQFELNSELRLQAEEMLKNKLEQINLQNQWAKAKSELELEKVHKRFRAKIEEDQIILYAIDTKDKVTSYIIEKLSGDS